LYSAGGLYVAKSLYIGTTTTHVGAVSIQSTLAVSGTSTLAALSATTITASGVVNANSTADVSTSTPASTSLYIAGGAYITKSLNVSGSSALTAYTATTGTLSGALTVAGNISGASTTDATSLTATTGINTSGGLAVQQTTWTKNLVVTTPYYSMWYTNSTQTITKNTVTNLTVGWTSWTQSSTTMSGAFAGTSGSASVYTMPYSGIYSLAANLRITNASTTAAGLVELWLTCSNSTIYGSTVIRLGHTGQYAPTSTLVAPNARFTGAFNAGDQVYITAYCQNGNLTIASGSDATFEVVLQTRTA